MQQSPQKMLSQLIPDMTLIADIPVSGISDDSRKARKGDLFLAISGRSHNAVDFIPDAAKKSVAAILCDFTYSKTKVSGVPVFRVDELAQRRGQIASDFYDQPSRKMQLIAITGTNGKTSVSQYIATAMTELAKSCGVIGTMGTGFKDQLKNSGLTTPDALSLQHSLAQLLSQGAAAVTLEASSHGLVQRRLDGTEVNVAVFTNITRDHLDYHESFEGYKKAKRSLFERNELEAAVINIDDEFGQRLGEYIDHKVRLLTYSLKNPKAHIYCQKLEFVSEGFNALVHTPWGDVSLESSLLGDFNVSNLLAVIGVLGQQGYSNVQMSSAISALGNVRGRMDVLKHPGCSSVVIDYAHTPDALKKAIVAIQLHCQQDVWCVMGCGGDRDKGKRPEMGLISSQLAEYTVVTDDNPRTESSDEIIANILAGVEKGAKVYVKSDRREAILYALTHAGIDDVVLIAGKGHEEYQDVMGVKKPYSDYGEVEKYFGAISDREES